MALPLEVRVQLVDQVRQLLGVTVARRFLVNHHNTIVCALLIANPLPFALASSLPKLDGKGQRRVHGYLGGEVQPRRRLVGRV